MGKVLNEKFHKGVRYTVSQSKLEGVYTITIYTPTEIHYNIEGNNSLSVHGLAKKVINRIFKISSDGRLTTDQKNNIYKFIEEELGKVKPKKRYTGYKYELKIGQVLIPNDVDIVSPSDVFVVASFPTSKEAIVLKADGSTTIESMKRLSDGYIPVDSFYEEVCEYYNLAEQAIAIKNDILTNISKITINNINSADIDECIVRAIRNSDYDDLTKKRMMEKYREK